MSNPLSAIGHFFKTVGVKVGEVFVKLVGSDSAHLFAAGAIDLLKSASGKLVIAAVEYAETLPTNGAGKREAAFKQVLDTAKTQGIELKDSIINLLIELAVQKLKGTLVLS